MFDAYVNQDANNKRKRRWLSVIIAGSVLAHMAVVVALIIAGMWKVERNKYKDRTNITVRTMRHGVVPPPPLGKPQATKARTKIKTRQVPVTLKQPTRNAVRIEVTGDGGGSNPGRPDGKPGGTGDNPDGQVSSITCPPGQLCDNVPGIPKVEVPPKCSDGTAPPCNRQPRIVTPNMISGARIAGDPQILPPDQVRLLIAKNDESLVVGAVLMCLDSSGRVAKVKRMRSTGYNAYDAKIVRNVRTWRYRPYRVNGTAVPVCTSITFHYKQR